MRMMVRFLVAASVVLATAVVSPATPSQALPSSTIQPGTQWHITLSVDPPAFAVCTLGFVYDGTGSLAGRVYIGTAAHCVLGVGQEVPLLTGEVIGDVAAVGDLFTTFQSADDWALIEVRPAVVGRVSAALKGHPQYPTGVTSPAQTSVGDPVQLANLLGFIPRQVPLTFDDAETYRVAGTRTAPPSVIPTDSGGPLVHVPTGEALGGISQGLNCQTPPTDCEEYEGPTVQGILAKAAAAGFPVALRTV